MENALNISYLQHPIGWFLEPITRTTMEPAPARYRGRNVNDAMVTVPAGAKVTVKILSSSSKYCKLVGSSVKGVKNGLCKVTLTVKPKKGSVVTKTVVLKVS